MINDFLINLQIRIAHLNFWGHREDALYRLRDITPLTETETNLNQVK